MSNNTAVQRESLMGPDISGSYVHYGHVDWWPPGEWVGDYRRPVCPVSQLGSTDTKAECTQIAKRITDEDGRGAWCCGWHGTFRVFAWPREKDGENRQQTLAELAAGNSEKESENV